jgi:adenylate kinase family enzyme
MLSKEDLYTLRSQNYQLIFNTGVPYSGKKTQCDKISKEFKYSKIIMKDIIQKEIDSKTTTGIQAKQSIENNEPIKIEILTSILISRIIESHELSIIIEGFPNTLEEALFFEQNVIPINKIIIYDAKEEECFNRMLEDKNRTEKMTKEEFSEIYKNSLKNMNEIFDFYSPFSIVHRVDVNGAIAQVNNELKKNLYPIIYSILGKRYSGKTTLSQELNSRIGMKLINFNEFLEEKEIKERKGETEFVINNFILKLRKFQETRVLIEDFPQNKEQYIYFLIY